ncbi:MAG: hypothetical protein U9R56_01040 [candidate division Zixibacteria bacterium]|nr:hypothetical protein [candidate division Zixibacteria bacterium]
MPVKVIQASDNIIMVDHSNTDCTNSLISNQQVIVRFQNRGQMVSVLGVLKAMGNGKSLITLNDKVVPLNRRRFVRHKLIRPMRLAVLPIASFQKQKMSQLRWIQTDTINCSGGGTLIDLSNYIESKTYLLTNIEFEVVSIPPLVIGLVRHCCQPTIGHFHIGIEFLVREILNKHLSPDIMKNLPSVVFEYTTAKQQELEMQFVTWMQKNESTGKDRS